MRLEKYRGDLAADALSDTEWLHLQEVADALRPFHDATQRLQGTGRHGTHGSIWEALPTLEFLLKHLESGVKPEGLKRRPTPLEIAHQNAWDKIRKYYEKTDDCHEIYAAGLLFHPCHRRAYFDNAWTEEEERRLKEQMLKNVKDVWSTDYCNAFALSTSPRESPAKRQKRERSPDAIEKHLLGIYEESHSEAVIGDDFDAYLAGSRLNPREITNVIGWWTEQPRQTALRQQALDVLSIPAMSTECERLFSAAGNLIGGLRYSLLDDTMERLESLRQWLRHGLVVVRGEI